MMSQSDLVSMQDTLKALCLTEEQLKRHVSEGAIRAFRRQDEFAFEADDVNRFARELVDSDEELLPQDEVCQLLHISYSDFGEVSLGQGIDPTLMGIGEGRFAVYKRDQMPAMSRRILAARQADSKEISPERSEGSQAAAKSDSVHQDKPSRAHRSASSLAWALILIGWISGFLSAMLYDLVVDFIILR